MDGNFKNNPWGRSIHQKDLIATSGESWDHFEKEYYFILENPCLRKMKFVVKTRGGTTKYFFFNYVISFHNIEEPTWLGLLNTPIVSLQRSKTRQHTHTHTHTMGILDMTLDYRMVRLQSWSFGMIDIKLNCLHNRNTWRHANEWVMLNRMISGK